MECKEGFMGRRLTGGLSFLSSLREYIYMLDLLQRKIVSVMILVLSLFSYGQAWGDGSFK